MILRGLSFDSEFRVKGRGIGDKCKRVALVADPIYLGLYFFLSNRGKTVLK